MVGPLAPDISTAQPRSSARWPGYHRPALGRGAGDFEDFKPDLLRRFQWGVRKEGDAVEFRRVFLKWLPGRVFNFFSLVLTPPEANPAALVI